MKTKNLLNLSKAAFICLGILVGSCTNETFEEAGVNGDDQLIKKFFNDDIVLVKDLGDGTYLGGDIIYTAEQLTDKRVGYSNDPTPGEELDEKLGLYRGIQKWPNNTIIYVFDSNLSNNQIQVSLNSMQEWTTKTNIKFKERTNENYYVTITSSGAGCNCASANLGVNGNRGRINMGIRTSEVVMIHEIGHTLGYIHEQTRSDRDNHVRILFENIQDGAASQFRKNNNSVNIGEFDIKSTMMYGAYTFSKNGQPTIVQLDGTTHPRRRPELSPGDITGTNQVYPAGDGDGGGDGDGDGNGNDICEGIDEWVRGQQYSVGDKVTYQGFLYERDFNRWNRLGECGDTQTADICEGISPYSGNTSYSPGDQVTYNGYLYTLQSNRRWSNQGRCAN
ncbi:M12 family metallopeptidase [Aquimarina sp. 2201CG14-23]|uniref:M12 family metallopeptidase n=1 Tax=Aquimarina mycalae TaxID=3040073 RepID=UPI002477F3F6|nr:M12 family metallopeptidase [Aquimarina sp. 2201CG14-23]MDH7445009.1 M12 family metallopeptidase [Aquimarina sp. 2201CG14-23]